MSCALRRSIDPSCAPSHANGDAAGAVAGVPGATGSAGAGGGGGGAATTCFAGDLDRNALDSAPGAVMTTDSKERTTVTPVLDDPTSTVRTPSTTYIASSPTHCR